MEPLQAAQAFVERHFPECRAAFFGGSLARGEGTPTSDLDVVVITERGGTPYRESFFEFGWPIEVFVHDEGSCRRFFASDAERRRPSLPRMCVEGIMLRDLDGSGRRVREEAAALLAAGPRPATALELELRRYSLTDLLDNLLGSTDPAETVLLAGQVAQDAADLVLLANRRWLGGGAWALRALASFDAGLEEELRRALRRVAEGGDRSPLLEFAERSLAAAGGRLFAGFRRQG